MAYNEKQAVEHNSRGSTAQCAHARIVSHVLPHVYNIFNVVLFTDRPETEYIH